MVSPSDKIKRQDARKDPKKEPVISNKELKGTNLTKAKGQEFVSRLLFKD